MLNAKMIGDKIADARKKKNISQALLAEQLFISAQAVGKWERGESMPDITTLNRLAEVLGVDLNYFSEKFQPANGETAQRTTADSFSDAGQTAQKTETLSSLRNLTNFNASNLPNSDFAGVSAHKSKFNASALQGSDFSGADLTDSSFMASDVREANFDGTNLTDCIFSATDLADASFTKAILVRTKFSILELTGTKFADANLLGVKFSKSDLRKTVFENCVFEDVDFSYCDLQGKSLDGLTFIGVKFSNVALNEATFNGATLKNVSFRAPYALTNKFYRSIKTICFDGAKMDKLTYAALKGLGADLSKVTTLSV